MSLSLIHICIRSVTLRQGSGDGYVALAAGSIRNSTEHPDADLLSLIHI